MTTQEQTVPYSRFQAVLARAKRAEGELEQLRLEQMQDRAAQLVGLPLELSNRLSGTNQDEMNEDAKRFLLELQGR